MRVWRIAQSVALTCVFCVPLNKVAARDNTFSASAFLGDSYAPNNFRLSMGSYDLGISDISELYFGKRLWRQDYYAGFGLASVGGFFGMLGYEWRFFPWMGLNFEFDGVMSTNGVAAGRGYIGIVAGW